MTRYCFCPTAYWPGSGGGAGGARDWFGKRSSRSFMTWLVLSVLFLRFFSSSRAWQGEKKRGKMNENRTVENTFLKLHAGSMFSAHHLHLLFQLHVGFLVGFWHWVQVVDGQSVKMKLFIFSFFFLVLLRVIQKNQEVYTKASYGNYPTIRKCKHHHVSYTRTPWAAQQVWWDRGWQHSWRAFPWRLVGLSQWSPWSHQTSSPSHYRYQHGQHVHVSPCVTCFVLFMVTPERPTVERWWQSHDGVDHR